jgi:hypothetical protein
MIQTKVLTKKPTNVMKQTNNLEQQKTNLLTQTCVTIQFNKTNQRHGTNQYNKRIKATKKNLPNVSLKKNMQSPLGVLLK